MREGEFVFVVALLLFVVVGGLILATIAVWPAVSILVRVLLIIITIIVLLLAIGASAYSSYAMRF